MRRLLRSLPAAVMLGASLGACVDSTAPDEAAPDHQTPAFRVTVDRMAPDSTSADFTVTPSGGSFSLGPHSIYFPANSICNPATSSYGLGTWDEPCQVLRTPIRIRAEIRRVEGREAVDFSPDLRFVPTRNPQRWVWIWMRSDVARDASQPRQVAILWSPGFGQRGIDESLDDPTLRTYVNPAAGAAYRRIKHFSGYQISQGRSAGEPDAGGSTNEMQ